MQKTPPKRLRGERREQTARILQQSHRLAAVISRLPLEPRKTTFEILNSVLKTEVPASSVTTNAEAARHLYLSVAISFPAMVLVFLLERFKGDSKLKARFETCLSDILAKRGPKGFHAVKMKHMISGYTCGFHVDSSETEIGAILRHIRNCLAHGSYVYEAKQTSTSAGRISLTDYNMRQSGPDKRSFQCNMEIEILAELAERMLILAHAAI